MAALKGTHSRKKRSRHFTYFPQVKGKIVESVEIDADLNAITILFQDKTALSFDLEPRLTVFPELSDWKTGNWLGNQTMASDSQQNIDGVMAIKSDPAEWRRFILWPVLLEDLFRRAARWMIGRNSIKFALRWKTTA